MIPENFISNNEIFRKAVELIDNEIPFVLAVVINTELSTPRKESAKMLILEDSIFGSIGGGPLEAIVIEEAKKILKQQSTSKKLIIDLKDSIGMKCGGKVEIFFDYVKPQSKIVIFGAGHIGSILAKIAKEIGEKIVLLDDRPKFANPKRFPDIKVICQDLENNPLNNLKIFENDFIVIATRCHKFDEICLQQSIKNTNAKYIGMIGSKRKVAEIFSSLQKKGLDVKNNSRIFAPIGLDIGGHSPGEIAVSILAEILKVKHSKSAAHLTITK